MRHLRFVSVFALAWTPFTALYALALLARRDMSVGTAIAGAAGSMLPAMLLGLPAWWVTGAIERRAWPWARQVTTHALLALAYSVLWLGSTVAQIAVFAPTDALASFLRFALAWQLLLGIVVYAVIVSAALTLAARARAREREAATSRAEAQRARAELHALRARLDPHFLFNALHSVTALVRVDPPAAEKALEGVAEMLRYVLDADRRGSDDVPLVDELAFVRTYLALERLRMGERLHVVERIDPDALECTIPALTLQPLVENAVRHGLAPLARGGTLRLEAAVVGDQLLLEVGDDGAGSEARASIWREGIGLGAVRQRILARFPGEVVVDVITALGRGFTVRIALPAVAHQARGPGASRRKTAVVHG